MPINSTHPQYKENVGLWVKCRDAVEGQEAIKKRGMVYLPALSGHLKVSDGAQAYQAYLNRALWFGATDRTLTGYVGAIMRKDPVFVVPDAMNLVLDNITGSYQSAVQFVHSVTKELLTTGRLGLLVDMAEDTDDEDDFPFIKMYYPENILNWFMDGHDLQCVMLQEDILQPKFEDPYEQECVTQIRCLCLDNVGKYTVIIYRNQGNGIDSWVPVKTTKPVVRGLPLTEIPFFFVSSDEDNYSCSKPPILDLVNCNINHYQLDADYRHGLHFTALPTPIFTGVEGDRDYYLGSECAINLRNENSKAFYLEFQGIGLNAIKDAMEERKSQMASLGAQLLSRKSGGRTVETAEAARIQQSGETSLLSTIVGRVEESLKRALWFVASFMNIDLPVGGNEIVVSINRDFIDATLNSQEITSLTQALQAGALSPEDLFWNFQRGGVVDPKKSLEAFKAELDAEKTRRLAAMPAGGPFGGTADNQGGTNGPGAVKPGGPGAASRSEAVK